MFPRRGQGRDIGGDTSPLSLQAEQILAYLPRREWKRAAISDGIFPEVSKLIPAATIIPLSQAHENDQPFDLLILAEGADTRDTAATDMSLLNGALQLVGADGVIAHDRPAATGLPGAAADLLDRVVYEADGGESRLLEVRMADAPLPPTANRPSSTVAAVVANYNYARYLREAIQSLEEQFLPPDEVIIIDDASTDDSEIVLSELEARGYRVVRNAVNLGPVETFRKAISFTRAELVFVLGADNRLRPDYISRSVAALDENPDCAIAYSDMLLFGGLAGRLAEKTSARNIGRSIGENWDVFRWRLPPPTAEVLATFAERNFVGGSSMFRRAAYEAAGGYRKVAGPEDHDLFYRIWKTGGGLTHIPACLLEYRQHSPAQANTVLGLELENRALKQQLAEHGAALRAARAELADLKTQATGTLTEAPFDTAAEATEAGHQAAENKELRAQLTSAQAAIETLKRERDALAKAQATKAAEDEERALITAVEHDARLSAEINEARTAAERARAAAQLEDIAGLAKSIEGSAIWPLLRLARSTRRRITAIRRRAETLLSDAPDKPGT